MSSIAHGYKTKIVTYVIYTHICMHAFCNWQQMLQFCVDGASQNAARLFTLFFKSDICVPPLPGLRSMEVCVNLTLGRIAFLTKQSKQTALRMKTEFKVLI